jgi:hypothetical protein
MLHAVDEINKEDVDTPSADEDAIGKAHISFHFSF